MNKNEWASSIDDEVKNMFELFQEEFLIPPMFTCLHLAGFCAANIAAVYARNDKDMPPELTKFLMEVLPDLHTEFSDMIKEQYLALNTKGTA